MTKKNLKTYNRIIRIAGDMIRRDGYDQVTVAQIVKEAGISLGTFYNYFPSKKSLLAGVRKIDSYFENVVRPLLKHQSLTEDFEIFWDKYVDYVLNDGLKTVNGTYLNFQAKLLIAEKAPLFSILLEILEEGVARGELREDCARRTLAGRLFMCAQGVTMQWVVRDGNLDIREELLSVTNDLLRVNLTQGADR